MKRKQCRICGRKKCPNISKKSDRQKAKKEIRRDLNGK